jgi:transcriptional regulator with XRE-family HTH domain
MVNRIQDILNHYNLTAAKFADQLNIPRSTISHILSERNKPSLEFIHKVLDKFPEINISWLVKGEGTIVNRADLFSEQTQNPNSREKISEKDLFSPENTINTPLVRPKKNYENLSEEKVYPNRPKPIENTDSIEQKNTPTMRGKKIIKIIVLYEDATFEDYYP